MNRKIGTVLSLLAIIIEIFSALFLTPLIIRFFGQAEYGIYTLILSITSYLSLLDLGVGNSVIKFMSKFRSNGDMDNQRRFLGVTTVYYFVVVVIMLVIGSIIYFLFPTLFSNGLSNAEILLGRKLLVLSILNIAVSIGTSGYFYTVVSYENFFVSKGLPIVFSILRIALSIVFLKLGFSSFAILFIQLITNLALRVCIVVIVLTVIKIKPTIRGVNKPFVKAIISYSALILLQMIAAQINNMLDHILIAAFVTSSSIILGIYGVGAQVSHYYQTFGGAMNSVIMPGVVKKAELNGSAETIQKEMIRIGRFNLMFVGIVFAVFVLYGQSFVNIWAGGENGDGYFVALLLMSPFVIIITQDIGLKFLWALDKQKFLSITKIIIVVINIFLTIVLIKWNPLIGASIGTFISLLVGDVILMQIVFKKELHINLFAYYFGLGKGILLSLLISAVSGFVFMLLGIGGILGFLLGCFIMVVVYLICLWLFGMNNYEKKYIYGIFNKLLRKGNHE